MNRINLANIREYKKFQLQRNKLKILLGKDSYKHLFGEDDKNSIHFQ